jgi:hypothetical protein
MKTYCGSGDIAPRILDLGTRRRRVVSFTPRPLYPQGKSPWYHWIGGWVGPRAFLDTVVKRKIPSPRWESNPRTPIVQPAAQCYTDWALTALNVTGYGLRAGKFSLLHYVLSSYQSTNGVHGHPLPFFVTHCLAKHSDNFTLHHIFRLTLYICLLTF